MIRIITILTFLVSFTGSAQWEQIGNTIMGEMDFDFTGVSVDINDQGNIIVVHDGLNIVNALGRVRVFELQGNNWIQIGNEVQGLVAENISSHSVRLNGQGNRFVLSSRLHNTGGMSKVGGVRVFELQGGNWVQLGNTLLGEQDGDLFGSSVAINQTGNIIIVGAEQSETIPASSGYAKIFELQGSNWIQIGSTIIGINPDDYNGKSVAINDAGTRIGITAPFNDDVFNDAGMLRVFDFENGDWEQVGVNIYGDAPDNLLGFSIEQGGNSMDFDATGNIFSIGIRGHDIFGNFEGRVKIYSLENDNWQLRGDPIDGTEENRAFGSMTSLNDSGNVLVSGDLNGYSNGSIRTFVYTTGSWNEVGSVLTGNEENTFFGTTAHLNSTGERLVVGAPLGDINGGVARGYVQAFQFDNILSIREINFVENLKLYPNPSSGRISVKLNAPTDELTIEIYDITGNKLNKTVSYNSNETTLSHQLSSGFYMVGISTSDGLYAVEKLVVE